MASPKENSFLTPKKYFSISFKIHFLNQATFQCGPNSVKQILKNKFLPMKT